MKVFLINPDYLKFLWAFDKKVPLNFTACDVYNSARPYIGTLNINGINYYAPFEHPRKGHLKLKKNMHIIKMYNGRLGIISLNNMIPVPESQLNELTPKMFENGILKEQYKFCIKFENLIRSRAELIYENSKNPNEFEKSIYCDFNKLTHLCAKYEAITSSYYERLHILLHWRYYTARFKKNAQWAHDSKA